MTKKNGTKDNGDLCTIVIYKAMPDGDICWTFLQRTISPREIEAKTNDFNAIKLVIQVVLWCRPEGKSGGFSFPFH